MNVRKGKCSYGEPNKTGKHPGEKDKDEPEVWKEPREINHPLGCEKDGLFHSGADCDSELKGSGQETSLIEFWEGK